MGQGESRGEAARPGVGSTTGADDLLVGRLAVERKLISREQLDEALAERAGRSLGQVLVAREWINVDQLLRLVADRDARSEPLPRLPRYEIREKIGEGASAIVYRAWDRELDRLVALKVLREIHGSEVARERFRRESKTSAGLTHPHVVTVHDAGEVDGRLYLVMELVEGRPLGKLLPSLDGEAVLSIVEKVARGLELAHARGIVHRDVKPSNILLTAEREPKIGDFGLAHLVDSDAELTRTGTLLGTPLYMSPEQVRAERRLTPRADVYALGVILYEGLLGRPPHVGESVPEIYEKIVKEEPVPPRRLKPEISEDLQTVLLKALDKEPERRYPTAGALADDLRRCANGEPIEARPLPALVRAWRRARPHRVWAASLAAALLGALAGAAWMSRTPDVARPAAGRPELDAAYDRLHERGLSLLDRAEPAADRVSGEWAKQDGTLRCGSAPFSKLQFAYEPPEEYDVLLEFARESGYGDVNVMLSRGGKGFLWVMGAQGNTVFGFASINGEWAGTNPTTRLENPCLENGRLYRVVVQVRKDGVWAYVDGKLKTGWRTDYRDVGLDDEWSLPDPRRLGLGTYESPSVFRRVSVLEISGKGRRLR